MLSLTRTILQSDTVINPSQALTHSLVSVYIREDEFSNKQTLHSQRIEYLYWRPTPGSWFMAIIRTVCLLCQYITDDIKLEHNPPTLLDWSQSTGIRVLDRRVTKASVTNYGGKQGKIYLQKLTELTNLENNSCFIFSPDLRERECLSDR